MTIPGPYGAMGEYFNATAGFQCVELAERFLAVADGLAPVFANGQQVAANYHSTYASTELYLNGSASAVGHAPVAGDVISFSNAPGFDAVTDGHVAVVSSSAVDKRTGNGALTIAQENVSRGYNRYTLLVEHWRLVDPNSAPDALFGFAYAEWLHVPPYRSTVGPAESSILAPETGAIEPVRRIVAGMMSNLGQPAKSRLRERTRRR